MKEPEPAPLTPDAILASPRMTRQQKIDRLREMAYDAREMDVAKEEGMLGGPPSRLHSILEALRALGADADDRPASHKQH